MKVNIILFFLLSIATNSFCQQELEVIKIKNEDRSVSISIVNYSDITYAVKVDFELLGYKAEPAIRSYMMVPADSTIFVTKLAPVSDKPSYRIHYRATPMDVANAETLITSPDVVLYSKNGQLASTQFRIYFEKNKIPFREYNASYSGETKAMFQAMLSRRGLDKNVVKLPVVVIKGEVFYNFDHIPTFLKRKFE